MKSVKIAIVGGKGGTGKTIVASNLAYLISEREKCEVLLVDVDVENPCTYTLFDTRRELVMTIDAFLPKFNLDKCVYCGTCSEKCPVHAILVVKGEKLVFFEVLCEGCATCIYVCPHRAIERGSREIGKIYSAKANNIDLVIGELNPGSRRYHEVMEKVLEYSEKLFRQYNYIIFDSPPGTGAGISMIISKADLVIVVTEPTMLGFSDLKKLTSLLKKENKKVIIVINKAGLSRKIEAEIEKFARENDFEIAKIPYSKEILETYIQGKLVVKEYPESSSAQAISRLYELIFSS